MIVGIERIDLRDHTIAVHGVMHYARHHPVSFPDRSAGIVEAAVVLGAPNHNGIVLGVLANVVELDGGDVEIPRFPMVTYIRRIEHAAVAADEQSVVDRGMESNCTAIRVDTRTK